MQWLKLPLSLSRSPALLTVSLAARGLFFQLFLAADADGRIEVPPGTIQEQVVQAIAHDPTSPTSPVAALDELTARGLVICAEGSIVVPLRLGTDTAGVASGGTGSRGGKSDADRARAYRQRKTGAGNVTTGVTESVTTTVTAPSRATVTGDSVTNCDASRTVTETVTGNTAANQAENKARETTVTATVTDRHGAREEEKREEKKEENLQRDVTVAVTAPSHSTLVLSSDSSSKAKRSKPEPQPDPVPAQGTLARRVYDIILGDQELCRIVEGPGSFAVKITADGAFPGVDVVAELRRITIWLDENRGAWNSRQAVTAWLRRAADKAALRPKPVGQAMSPAYVSPGDAVAKGLHSLEVIRTLRERDAAAAAAKAAAKAAEQKAAGT